MKLSQLLGRIAPILAPMFLLVLIGINGVNVPFWDEWSTPGEFLTKDNLTFKDFFDQSNESRLLVPKLIFLGVSKFVGWQPKHYMYFGWLIVLAILFLVYRISYRRLDRGRAQDGIGLLCLVFSSALLFSPAAFENWLWGLQWVIFVPLLCALIAFTMQTRAQTFSVRFGVTVLLNAVGMFSFSNGMILWIVSFPFWREVLGFLSGKRPSKATLVSWLAWSAAYCLTAVISVRIYFTGYRNVFPEPPMAFAMKEPWSVVKYFAAWCGGPFHSNAAMHMAIGAALLLTVLMLVGWLTKTIKQQPEEKSYLYLTMLYPSVMVMVYALGSGMMTALGRASFGVEQAYSSRYLFHSATLWVGFIAALNTHRILATNEGKESKKFSQVFLTVLIVFSALLVRTWNHAYKQFDLLRIARLQTLLNVRMLAIAPKSPMVEKTCPWLDLPLLVKTLTEKGIYNPSVFGEWLIEEAKHPQLVSGGIVQVVPRPQPEMGVMGWASIPDRNAPADSVLICRKSKTGTWEPFIMLAVGFHRNDLVRQTGKPSLRKSGFLEVFPWPETDDFATVEMFSVDERNQHLYPISRIP